MGLRRFTRKLYDSFLPMFRPSRGTSSKAGKKHRKEEAKIGFGIEYPIARIAVKELQNRFLCGQEVNWRK